jgi:hypothetical protein
MMKQCQIYGSKKQTLQETLEEFLSLYRDFGEVLAVCGGP